MHGPMYSAAFGSPIPMSVARPRTAAAVVSVNGAAPSGVGSRPSTRWCMIGFPTTTRSCTLLWSAPASPHNSPTSSSMAVRTAAVSSVSPPGFIIT